MSNAPKFPKAAEQVGQPNRYLDNGIVSIGNNRERAKKFRNTGKRTMRFWNKVSAL